MAKRSLISRVTYATLFALLLGLTLWIYWPGQTGVPFLDDRANLGQLENLADSPQLAREYIFGNQSGPLGRPVSMASFVLEKLLFQGDFGLSKRVNVFLHLVNGLLLVYLLVLLLRYVDVPGHQWIALLAGGLWLLSPMQVSTVLYAVQRMAMLSTLFMLLASICYVRWRIRLAQGDIRCLWFLPLLLFAILALFSKENGVLILPVLWLLEALWFQCRSESLLYQRRIERVTRMTGIVGVVVAGAVLVIWWEAVLEAYAGRSFSLSQRLMTEPRVLWDYVAQFVWPELSRLGLYHDDIQVSTSLGEPSTTLAAVVAWGTIVALSLLLLRWPLGRYLVLGPALYLVSHSLESTFWPLELYFEHRNYFPSIGIVLFFAVAVSLLLRCWPEVRRPVFVFIGVFLLLVAGRTSSQVQVWSNATLLVFNHVIGHPESYRANADMAMLMATQGDLATAEPYFARARELGRTQSNGDHLVLDVILHCLADREFGSDTDFDRAPPIERRVVTPSTLLTLLHLVQENYCPSVDVARYADSMVEVYLEPGRAPAADKVLLALASLENSLQRYYFANGYIDRFLALRPADVTGLLMKLHFSTALGLEAEAQIVVSRLRELDRKGVLTTGQRQTLQLYLR